MDHIALAPNAKPHGPSSKRQRQGYLRTRANQVCKLPAIFAVQ